MTDLIDFVRARLAEDERATRLDSTARNGVESTAGADVLAYVDRALREVEAKRRILDAAEAAFDYAEDDPNSETGAADSSTYCHVLRLLALPYADHPSYRPEWRP